MCHIYIIQGLFSSVFKEAKSSKEKPEHDVERDDSPESFQRLAVIFSTDNFPSEVGVGSKGVVADADERQVRPKDEEDDDLNIGRYQVHSIIAFMKFLLPKHFFFPHEDDIDLGDIDIEAKPKAQNMFAGLNKNLTSKMNTFKGQ